jgi:hypothetical protein
LKEKKRKKLVNRNHSPPWSSFTYKDNDDPSAGCTSYIPSNGVSSGSSSILRSACALCTRSVIYLSLTSGFGPLHFLHLRTFLPPRDPIGFNACLCSCIMSFASLSPSERGRRCHLRSGPRIPPPPLHVTGPSPRFIAQGKEEEDETSE